MTGAQSLLQWCAARQMVQSLPDCNRIEDLRFPAVMESSLMHHAFWPRQPFFLRETMAVTRLVGDDEDMLVVVDDDVRFRNLARRSLVEWDGRKNLANTVEANFGLHDQDDGLRQWAFFTNEMAVLRILYRPSPEARKTFEQLRRFTFEICAIDHVARKVKRGPRKMMLAVVVHFGRPNGPDVVRMYDIEAKQIHIDGGPTYLEDDSWTLGSEDEGQYMLYYIPEPPFPSETSTETRPRLPSAAPYLERISVAGELWGQDEEEQEAEDDEQQENCYEEDDEYEQQGGYYDEEGRDGDDEMSQCEDEEESSLEDHSQLEVEATTHESKPLSTPAKSRASTTAATYKDREQGQDQDGQTPANQAKTGSEMMMKI